MFDKIKELWELKNKAEQIKKELENLKFTAEDEFSSVSVKGTFEIDSITIKADISGTNKNRIENSIKENINRALRNAQIESARRVMG